jgi:hypothetical protein
MTATNNIHNSENGTDQRLKQLFGTDTSLKAPEGYFEELPARVLDSCRQSDNKNIRPLYLRPIFRRITAAAAILIMAALVITIIFTDRQPQADDLSEYTLVEIYQMNFSNLAELEEIYLLSLLEDESYLDSYKIAVDTADITDEDIYQYLVSENQIELYTLSNQQ